MKVFPPLDNISHLMTDFSERNSLMKGLLLFSSTFRAATRNYLNFAAAVNAASTHSSSSNQSKKVQIRVNRLGQESRLGLYLR